MVRKLLSSRHFSSFLSQLHFSDSSSAHDPVKPHVQPPVAKFAPPSMSCSGRHVKPTMNIHLQLIWRENTRIWWTVDSNQRLPSELLTEICWQICNEYQRNNHRAFHILSPAFCFPCHDRRLSLQRLLCQSCYSIQEMDPCQEHRQDRWDNHHWRRWRLLSLWCRFQGIWHERWHLFDLSWMHQSHCKFRYQNEIC